MKSSKQEEHTTDLKPFRSNGACGYKNKEHIKHMRKISRKYILLFLKSEIVSKKFKLYAIAACLGY